MNDRLLRALLRQTVDETPVWLMRQAGRYLPEYRATRKAAGDFMTLCTTPELACEVTLQPLRRFALDAAILFSDILVLPHAMGLGLTVLEGAGPRLAHPVRSAADVHALGVPDPTEKLRYVLDTVQLVRRELEGRVPLIGFAGSPWTLATYMVEGGPSEDFRHVKGMLYDDPALLHALLAKLAQGVSDLLNAQIAAGAQVVMLFDTWGGVLSKPAYLEFSLRYLEMVVHALARRTSDGQVPVILFTKGGGQWLAEIAATGCDAVGLDWTVDLGEARRAVGDRVALQGNLDPAALRAPVEVLRAQTAKLLEAFGPGSGHVFNLGHGVTRDTDPDQVAALVDAVHELSRPLH